MCWHVIDSFFNTVDTVYAQNGYTADNHDFLALQMGIMFYFVVSLQPFPMDEVVPGGSPDAIVEGVVIQELNSDAEVRYFNGKAGIILV